MSAPRPSLLQLAALGAASCALVACPAAPKSPPLAAFDAERAWTDLRKIVHFGPRPPGSQALEETRALLAQELTAAGLKPVRETFKAQTPSGGIEFTNVYADLTAADPQAEIVILAAHIDTKLGIPGFVGANDGGSGTVAVLELARAIAKSAPRPVTYRFLFVDGEEAIRMQWEGDDNCYGSRHHARVLQESGVAERVRAFVLLDMVGDADLKLWRETWSDRRLTELFRSAATEAGLGKHLSQREEAIGDDHQPFLAAGIPSVDLIDFEYGTGNSVWHTAFDNLDHCSKDSLGAIGKIVLTALPKLESEFRRR